MRTRKEIDTDYSNSAILLGHKYRVLAQVKIEAERLEKEIQEHLNTLLSLNQEGMALPPEEKSELKAVPEVATEAAQ